MKAFVTGATGFIGRHLVRLLLQQGAAVTALVRRPMHGLPPPVNTVMGDITQADSLRNAQTEFTHLFHLAASISFNPQESERLNRVNGLGTRNILDAAKRWGVKRAVLVSSACTMGITSRGDNLLNENSVVDRKKVFRNPYLQSKLLAEKMAEEYAHGMDVVVVNPTTVYGPGDWSLNSGTMVKKVFSSKVLPIPPGGSNVVDVEDVVQGIVAAAEKGQSGKRYILGGENLSFHHIITVIGRIIGRRPMLVRLPNMALIPVAMAAHMVGVLTKDRFMTFQMIADMFKYKYYSIQAARQDLQWQPELLFTDSIQRAWNFYRTNALI